MSKIDVTRLSRKIATVAAQCDEGDQLLGTFCEMMVIAGLSLWRVAISMPALDPASSGFSLEWTQEEGVLLTRTLHGDDDHLPFMRQHVQSLFEADRKARRWRLDEPVDDHFPFLGQLRDAGATDYLLHLVTFAPGSALRGVALSFSTRQAGGFVRSERKAIAELVPVLGLAMGKLALAHTLRRTLDAYLSAGAGEQVLGGRIRRGECRTLPAAILLADLRGFTTLADRSDPADVVGWLDEHFEVLGKPVTEHGGHILKFLGDGFLAIFPVQVPDRLPCVDCERALEAAFVAERSNNELNVRRRARGLPHLDVDLVLHFGEVMYGNVGTSERLDFTVIGRAVNEASRMEKYCSDIGHTILISDTFAGRCRTPLTPVGLVSLRGVDLPQRIWTAKSA